MDLHGLKYESTTVHPDVKKYIEIQARIKEVKLIEQRILDPYIATRIRKLVQQLKKLGR